MNLNQSITPAEEEVLQEEIQEEEQKREEDNVSAESIIETWRAQYGKIYLSVYDEQEFIWRKINRLEYVEIMDNTAEGEENIDDLVEYRQRLTLYKCMLSPTSKEVLDILIDDYPGILTSLSAEILKKSGFSKPLTIEI